MIKFKKLKKSKTLLLLFTISALLFFSVAGKLLVVGGLPVKSDLIVVLSGLEPDRPKEAAELYLAGYAPKVLITTPVLQGHEVAYAQEGILLESREELFEKLLVKKKFQSLT